METIFTTQEHNKIQTLINETMEEQKNKSVLETWLPIFPGFYGTIFEYSNEDMDIEAFEQETGKEDLNWDNFNWDYEDYNNRVAEACCEAIENKLQEYFDLVINFQNVSSPREYNFANDSINIEIIASKGTLSKIREYLLENIEEYKEYVRRKYTSCDGFISRYSNNAYTWINDYMFKMQDNGHYLGSILQFVLINEEFTEEDLYYKTDHENYVGYELKEEEEND
jgi:hypothetical protein